MSGADRPPSPGFYAILVASTGGAALLGFAREAAVARLLGATRVTDAYYAALALPFVAAWFLVGGALAPPLTRAMAERLEAGDRDGARRLLSRGAGRATVVGLAAGVALAVFSTGFLSLLAPGFDPPTRRLAAGLFVVLLGYGLATSVALLLGAALTAAGSYRRPIFSTLLANALSLGFLLVAGERLGVAAAAWGLVAGAVAMLALHLHGLAAVGLLPWGVPKGSTVVVPWRDGALLAVGLAAAGGIDLVERGLSSTTPAGTVALLALAGKLVHLPMRLVAAPLASVAFPRFVRARARSVGTGQGAAEAGSTAAWVVRLLLVAAVVTAVAAQPLVSVAFGRGRFDAAAVTSLAQLLALLAPAVVAVGVVEIAAKYLLAAGLARFVVFAQAGGLAVYLVSAPLLVRFGAPGLAVARDLAWLAAAAGLALPLVRREPALSLFPRPGRAAAATLAGLAAAWGGARITPAPPMAIVVVATLSAVGGFFGVLLLSGAALRPKWEP